MRKVVDIFCIQETTEITIVKLIAGLKSMDLVLAGSTGDSGGILIAWNLDNWDGRQNF